MFEWCDVVYLVNNVDTDGDLENIVNNDGCFEVERFAILHQSRPEPFDAVDIAQTNQKSWERWAH